MARRGPNRHRHEREFANWLTRIVGGLPLLIGSLAFIVVGMFWLSQAGTDATYWQLALPMILIGIGNGTAMVPLTASGVRGVEPRDQGSASGLVNVANQLGGSVGLSLLIVVFASAAVELGHVRNGAEHPSPRSCRTAAGRCPKRVFHALARTRRGCARHL